MKLFPGGGELYERVSRYDDLLTPEGAPDYEPGDILTLIIPFLALHGISDDDIRSLSHQATITGGARELISWLQEKSWRIFCVSTCFQPYAERIINKLGIFNQNLACTFLSIDKFSGLAKEDEEHIRQAEEAILNIPLSEDTRIKQTLDKFYNETLPRTSLGADIKSVKPVGGEWKVQALKRFAEAHAQPLSQWVVVGDSFTDIKMLKAVDEAGGLAVAFNGDENAISYATMALASTHLSDLKPALEAWQHGQRKAAEKLVKDKEKRGGAGDRNNFNWIAGRKDIEKIVEIHKRIRDIASR